MPRFQYSLRTVLIVMAVLAVPLGWWSYKAEKQRRAVEALEKSGAKIFYNDGSHTGYTPLESRFVHWQYRVETVSLSMLPSDSDIEALRSLDGLEKVYCLNNTDAKKLRVALPKCMVEQATTGFGGE